MITHPVPKKFLVALWLMGVYVSAVLALMISKIVRSCVRHRSEGMRTQSIPGPSGCLPNLQDHTSHSRIYFSMLICKNYHQATKFMLLGFTYVNATLWKVEDQPCSEIAVKFYELLSRDKKIRDSVGGFSNYDIAKAFMTLRRRRGNGIWN